MIGTDLMQMVNDFRHKVLEHEHDAVTFFEHYVFIMEDLLFFLLLFLILTFKQLQIGLFFNLIFVHFFHLLPIRCDKVLFFRINELFFGGDIVFHVVIFVVDEFHL